MLSLFRTIVLVLMATMAVSSCQTITPRRLEPPKAQPLAQNRLKRIAILPFEGEHGLTFSTELEHYLSQLEIGKTPVFHVVPWSQIDPLLNSMQLIPTQPISVDAAIEMGQQLNVEAVFIGKVLTTSVKATQSTQHQEICERQGVLNTCQAGTQRQVEVPCVGKIAQFIVEPTLLEVATGEVLYTQKVTGEATVEHCGVIDIGYDDYQMQRQARYKALTLIHCQVAPCYGENYEINFRGLEFFN